MQRETLSQREVEVVEAGKRQHHADHQHQRLGLDPFGEQRAERRRDHAADQQAHRGERERPPACLLYTSPSPRDRQKSRMPSSA